MLFSLFLVLIGSRAALIAYAASPTPFLDEWDADATHLLKPYLQGHLTIADLLYPINEHRIPFTKLAVLSVYEVSGYWDVILQMIANAFVEFHHRRRGRLRFGAGSFRRLGDRRHGHFDGDQRHPLRL